MPFKIDPCDPHVLFESDGILGGIDERSLRITIRRTGTRRLQEKETPNGPGE